MIAVRNSVGLLHLQYLINCIIKGYRTSVFSSANDKSEYTWHVFIFVILRLYKHTFQNEEVSGGSPGLKVKFQFSFSPEVNIAVHMHMHGDI